MKFLTPTFLLAMASNARGFRRSGSSFLTYCDNSNNASGNTERFLNDGNVVHYNDSTQTIPRNEVVSAVQAALDGGSNFEVETNLGSHITFRDLTRNGMELSSADLDGDFSVSNAFVIDQPDILYDVTCPAASDECNVAETGPDFFGTRACLLKEDGISNIPQDCLDQEYDLKFYVVKGPHFMLGASTSIDGCPNIAFLSLDGDKQKIKFETQDVGDIPSYYFGKVALNDILKVEEDTPPLTNENFNLETNNCAHYSQRIWRSLGFAESDELAQFIVNHISNDPNSEELAKAHVGGVRYLAAKALGATIKEYLEEVVYSQFAINN